MTGYLFQRRADAQCPFRRTQPAPLPRATAEAHGTDPETLHHLCYGQGFLESGSLPVARFPHLDTNTAIDFMDRGDGCVASALRLHQEV
jgi:hypothetical protein